MAQPYASRRGTKQAITKATGGHVFRSDLHVVAQESSGCRWWLFHDPLRNAYHRLTHQDAMAIESGAASPALLHEAAQLGLLAQQPMGLALPRRFNWMSLKLPGVPMDQGARWLAARTGWLFSAPAVAIWMLFVGLALATVAVHWQRLILDLPGLKQMATVEHAALLLAITVCTKVLHELGHAVSCRRLGARVGDLGFLLLCGTPCMYCDVSDAWILSRRRERAAVMMAGMYVEWVLAAIATFGWFMTGPGLFNTICLDVMLVCSVSTLVFNGNPLMRHDGYYIFGDLLNLPNLSVSASESYYRVVKQLLGRERAAGVDYLLTLYHLSSIVYRSMVNVLIGCWLGRMLTACHLLPAAIVAVTASGMNAVTPWWNGWRQWLRGQGPWNEIPRMQRWLVTGMFLLLLVIGAAVSTSTRVAAKGVVEPKQAMTVFVPGLGGQVVEVRARSGQSVSAGEVLAVLQNPQSDYECLSAQGKCELLRAKLNGLQRRATLEPELLTQRQTLQEALRAAERQLEILAKEREQLVLRAPIDGVVWPTVDQPYPDDQFAIGKWMQANQPWCRVGPSEPLAVQVIVDRNERRHLGQGATLFVRNVSAPTEVVRGRVVYVQDRDEAPADQIDMTQDSRNSRSAARQVATKQEVPQVHVLCELPGGVTWLPGSQVEGWIEGPREPNWQRWSRNLYQLFAP